VGGIARNTHPCKPRGLLLAPSADSDRAERINRAIMSVEKGCSGAQGGGNPEKRREKASRPKAACPIHHLAAAFEGRKRAGGDLENPKRPTSIRGSLLVWVLNRLCKGSTKIGGILDLDDISVSYNGPRVASYRVTGNNGDRFCLKTGHILSVFQTTGRYLRTIG